MAKEVDTRYTQDRELSWLRFNERVLEEAKDESVPLMERLKFAAIFTSNLDEFFMIRVGSLYDMTLVKEEHIDSRTGQTPEQQLQAIFKAVTPLYKQRDKVVEQLESRLRACNICRMSMDEMDTKERKQVENWFQDEVRPILSPQVVDSRHPFPHLSNKTLNVVLRLESEGQQFLGLIPVPQSLPPYFTLRERGLRYILTEDVIAEYAKRLFPAFDVKGKAVASVTRNADISPEDETYEVDEDFRQHMRKIVKKRNRLAPVRLELQGGRDDRAIDFLCRQLNLSREQVFFSKSPLRMKYVFSLEGQLPPESKTALCYPPYTPKASNFLRPEEKVLPQVLHHDVLLFYPFQSMDPFLHLVREASSDPDVLSIKITIYRLASKAKLAEYLCAAAENGKEVTALMELRARFDEQNNIQWAERMEEAGCTILYGAENIKVHSKVCLITRRDKGKIQYITQVGTGNYNEKTAKQYTDLCLMTARPEIGEDAAALFRNMATANMEGNYKQLLVSPYQLRDKCMEHIDREIAGALPGGAEENLPHHRRAHLRQREGPPAGPRRGVARPEGGQRPLLQPGGLPGGGHPGGAVHPRAPRQAQEGQRIPLEAAVRPGKINSNTAAGGSIWSRPFLSFPGFGVLELRPVQLPPGFVIKDRDHTAVDGGNPVESMVEAPVCHKLPSGDPPLLQLRDKLEGPLLHGLPLQSNSLGAVLRRAVRPTIQNVLPQGAVGGVSPERSVPVGDLQGQLGGGRPLGRVRRHHTGSPEKPKHPRHRSQYRSVSLPGPKIEAT